MGLAQARPNKPRHSDVKLYKKICCSRAMFVQPTVRSLVLRVVGYGLKYKLLFDGHFQRAPMDSHKTSP